MKQTQVEDSLNNLVEDVLVHGYKLSKERIEAEKRYLHKVNGEISEELFGEYVGWIGVVEQHYKI